MYSYPAFARIFNDSFLQEVIDPREWYLAEMLRMNADPGMENPATSVILRQPGYPAWMYDPIPHTQTERFDIEQLWIRNISTLHREYQSLDLYCNSYITQKEYDMIAPETLDQSRQFTRDFGKHIELLASQSNLTLTLAVFHLLEWDPEQQYYLVPHFHFLCFREYPVS